MTILRAYDAKISGLRITFDFVSKSWSNCGADRDARSLSFKQILNVNLCCVLVLLAIFEQPMMMLKNKHIVILAYFYAENISIGSGPGGNSFEPS